MSNPLVLDVADILRHPGTTFDRRVSGPAPVRLGLEMIAAPEGSPVVGDVQLTNLGEGLMVSADLTIKLAGECARCLAQIDDDLRLNLHTVFGFTEDFISGDADEDEDPQPVVEDGQIDLTQLIIDEVGTRLPFSPTCEEFDRQCDEATPEPDGIAEEVAAQEPPVDPRWAALADKFGMSESTSDADSIESTEND